MEALLKTEYISVLALAAVISPLLSFFPGMFFTKPGKGSSLAITFSALSFLLSACCFLLIWNQREIHQLVQWFSVGDMSFSAGILLNNLSVLMMALVSGISLLVHIYSTAYMKADANLHRYWAYLGLFCFAMMGIVVADNLLLLYSFWELVGLSSYLLIGFWFNKEAAVRANKKAFIMNRIGDLGFLAGMLILYTQFQTLDISRLFGEDGLLTKAVIINNLWISSTNQLPAIWLTIAGLTIFFGAMAKSAQFPLHTWLPDAMEGPTSVSALIHAATMVAAGVFLLLRVFPLFNETVLLFITFIGSFTAFMAATIAIMQTDMKKILAYSTISQLGLMILAVGTGAFSAAIFHLATHAFFKCLLFLGAGAVIHQMQHLKERSGLNFDPQDIRNMGGLRHFMPVTFIVMLIAALALSGFPLTSGYLSKDSILIHAFKWAGNQQGLAVIVPYLALLTSLATTFYMGRLIFRVFFRQFGIVGLPAGSTMHEAPQAMKIPMLILAACCLYPVFSVNMLHAGNSWILAGFPQTEAIEHVDILTLLIPLTLNVSGIFILYLTWRWYGRTESKGLNETGTMKQFFLNGWYFNELYDILWVKPLVFISRLSSGIDNKVVDGLVNRVGSTGLAFSKISAWTDLNVIDACVNFLGTFSKSIGNFTRRFQSGRVQSYLFVALASMLLFFIINFIIRIL